MSLRDKLKGVGYACVFGIGIYLGAVQLPKVLHPSLRQELESTLLEKINIEYHLVKDPVSGMELVYYDLEWRKRGLMPLIEYDQKKNNWEEERKFRITPVPDTRRDR